MNQISGKIRGLLLGIGACLLLATAVTAPCLSQQKTITQTAGVDNTKMGAYRALAQLSFKAFQKGDNATAAELARILERTWDAAEEGGGDTSLLKRNKDLFEQIDKEMEAFIKPLIIYATKAPNPTAVHSAYNAFLEKLNKGD